MDFAEFARTLYLLFIVFLIFAGIAAGLWCIIFIPLYLVKWLFGERVYNKVNLVLLAIAAWLGWAGRKR